MAAIQISYSLYCPNHPIKYVKTAFNFSSWSEYYLDIAYNDIKLMFLMLFVFSQSSIACVPDPKVKGLCNRRRFLVQELSRIVSEF